MLSHEIKINLSYFARRRICVSLFCALPCSPGHHQFMIDDSTFFSKYDCKYLQISAALRRDLRWRILISSAAFLSAYLITMVSAVALICAAMVFLPSENMAQYRKDYYRYVSTFIYFYSGLTLST